MGVRRLAAAASAGLLLPALAALPAHAQDEVDVIVFHGIPGLTVDVEVDGELVLDDFEYDGGDNPAILAVPLETEFEVEIFDETGGTSLLGPETFSADGFLSLVAHLDDNGEPVLSEFVDDAARLCDGDGAVVVRHTAAAGEVDIAVEGDVVGTIANGEELSAALPEGTYSAEVRLAGTDTVVLGPAGLDLTAGVVTYVYAVGAPAGEGEEESTLDLFVFDYEVGTESCEEPSPTPTATQPVPTAVPAGQAGTAVSSTVPVLAALGVLFVAGLGGAVAVVRARRHEG